MDLWARSGVVTARARCVVAIIVFNSSVCVCVFLRVCDDEVVYLFVDYYSDCVMWCYIGCEVNERGFRRGFVRIIVLNYERFSRYV